MGEGERKPSPTIGYWIPEMNYIVIQILIGSSGAE
jgi:hypothetical protein